MRTTKIQRTAWNITKLCAIVDPFDSPDSGLYELGKDAGIAFIHAHGWGIPQYVAIPQKEWDKAVKFERDAERVGVETNRRQKCAQHWYEMAMLHKF